MIQAPFGGVWRLEVHETLGSTSDEVLARVAAGEAAGLAVMARRQTKGRGTAGRSWSDGDGNLAMSVLLRPGDAIREPGQLAIRAAVALHQALTLEIGSRIGAQLRIKWPNDILLEGRKLAGILVETAIAAGGGIDWACIGLGVNLATTPDLGGVSTACLAEICPAPDPVRFGESLLGTLATWLDACFEPVRAAWTRVAYAAGDMLEIRRGGGIVLGRFVALGDRGELLLDAEDGRVALSAGDVRSPSPIPPRTG